MVEAVSNFVYVAPVVVGLVGGLLELVLVHGDEPGMGWFGHGMHAVPFCIFFAFLSMNLGFFYQFSPVPIQGNMLYDIGIRALIGLIAAFKIKVAAAVTKGHNSVGEKLIHALVIGAFLAASPYLWPYVGNMLPPMLQK